MRGFFSVYRGMFRTLLEAMVHHRRQRAPGTLAHSVPRILELSQVRGKVPSSAGYDWVLVLNVKINGCIPLGLGSGS